MLMWFAFIGLGLLVLGSFRWYLLIVSAMVLYYLINTYVPSYFGYSINSSYLGQVEARIVGIYGSQYLVAVIKDEDEPRLIKVRNIKQETRNNMKNRGFSIIKFNSPKIEGEFDSGGNDMGNDGDDYTEIDLNSTPEFKKD